MRGSGDPSVFAVDPADPEAWQAQLFRSIDSDSAAGLPPGSEASRLGLDSGKGDCYASSFLMKVPTLVGVSVHLCCRKDPLKPRPPIHNGGF